MIMFTVQKKGKQKEKNNEFDLAGLNAIKLSCEMQKEILNKKKVKKKVNNWFNRSFHFPTWKP